MLTKQKVGKEAQRADQQKTNNEMRLKSAISMIILNNALNTPGFQPVKAGSKARQFR